MSKLNASHIISRWERVRTVWRGHRSSWFLLLYAACAGTAGITKDRLRAAAGVRTGEIHAVINRLAGAGLIKLEARLEPKGRPSTLVRITDAGLEFLGLAPVPEAGIQQEITEATESQSSEPLLSPVKTRDGKEAA